MNKILTVVIPTYNMEKYLNRCLDSFIIEDKDLLNKLEVIVVNDGSKDSSSVIAHEYQHKYPDTFYVIDKENGHYGSCINAALKIATGKYFRIVDADDWVDTQNLTTLVRELEHHNEDAIFTRFTLQNEKLGKAIEQDDKGMEYNKTLDLNHYAIPEPCLAMHNYSFKLSHLRDINYCQTEGICYTDTEYVYFPLCSAKTLYCFDVSLYQYYIGRNEQTMAIGPLVKNYSHFEKVLNKLWSNEVATPNCNYNMIRTHYDVLLMQYMYQINCIYAERSKDRENKLYERMQSLIIRDKDAYDILIHSDYHGIKYIRCCINNGVFDRLLLRIVHTLFKLKNH